jgi:TonB family protein
MPDKPMRATLTSLVAVVVASSARAAEPLVVCSPMPALVRSSTPSYPPHMEPRGLPNPVSIVVELTISAEGHPSDARVIENDAGFYTRLFDEQALEAVATWRFSPISKPCRARVKIVFKVAG